MKNVVQETVQTEIKSYSEAVQKTSPALTLKSVKTAVKQAKAEEDRSRSVIVYGLREEKTENLSSKVDNLLEQFGEKPRHESSRIGTQSDPQKPRPVKIKLPSSASVHSILQAAKTLKQSSDYRSVYIHPDRTPAERASRREAVSLLKKRIRDDPNQRYYILKGEVKSSKE